MGQLKRARRRKRRERQEGAVLLVVLLVVMVATATAAASVSNTQSEIRAVGQERTALHGRYAAEAALNATIAWFTFQNDQGNLRSDWDGWERDSIAGVFPEMRSYGERQPVLSNKISGRVPQNLQVFNAPAVGYVSATNAITAGAGGTTGGSGGTTGGSGGTTGGAGGSTPSAADPINSVGPNQRYVPAPYIIDITECKGAGAGARPGDPVKPDENGQITVRCTVTSRAQLTAGDSTNRTWSFDGLNNFTLPRYSTKHAARAEVILGPM
jgi:hypothetical protein